MIIVALVVACSALLVQGRRVQVRHAEFQNDSQEDRLRSQGSRSHRRVHMKALASLLEVLNPKLGWQVHASGYTPAGINVCSLLHVRSSNSKKKGASKRAAAAQALTPWQNLALSVEEQTAAIDVRRWLDRYIIRHRLCPWARMADAGGGVRIVVSKAKNERAVVADLQREARRLLEPPPPPARPPPRLATTLLVCPSVSTWTDDFVRFDEFVKDVQDNVLSGIRLVAFHPNFSRWRVAEPGTSDELNVGDNVTAYVYEAWLDPEEVAAAEADADEGENINVPAHYFKSETPVPAVIENLDEKKVGVRKVMVSFHVPAEDSGEDVQLHDLVPTDWVTRNADTPHSSYQLRADNLIHKSPLPVIHLLHSEELGEETQRVGMGFIKQLQWRNACLARRAQSIFQRLAPGPK